MVKEIVKVEVGRHPTNCYLVIDESKKAAIIDPGEDWSKIKEELNKFEATQEIVLLTHGHYDHISALKEFDKAKVYIHKLEYPYLFNNSLNLSEFATGKTLSLDLKDVEVFEDGNVVEFLDNKFKVMHTPGHTPGSSMFFLGEVIFSGDTLFKGVVGRCDLAGSDVEKMKESTKRIAKILGDYDVYPGHGDSTKLSIEKIHNPYLLSW